MTRVAFLPLNAAAWGEMAALATQLREQGRAEPLMLLAGERMARFADEGAALGLRCASLDDLPAPPGPAAPAGLSPTRLLRSLRWRLIGPAAELKEIKLHHIARLERQRAQLAGVLESFRPTAGVTAGDRQPWWELPFLGWCRDNGASTLAAPVAYVGDAESLLPRRTSPFHLAANFPALAARLPGQTMPSPRAGGPVFFYEAPLTLALEELGLLPANPWAHGCGLTELVLAESLEAKERYVKGGADPERIRVTGLRVHDLLRQGLRRCGLERGGRRGDQGPVVLAMPQLAEEGMLDWERHWREARFLCQVISQEAPGRGVVSLHPRMDRAAYAWVEDEFGLTLAERRLAEFLPEASLFLCSWSSTIFWATLCHIPSVILDFYGYGYTNWDFLTGLEVVDQRERLSPVVRRLVGDPGHYASQVAEQARWAPLLSPMDGRCTERILQAICDAPSKGDDS